MKLILRFVTLVCYFFPFTFFFTTCHNSVELRFSYNRIEADKNILLEKTGNKAVSHTGLYNQHILIDSAKTDTVRQKELKDKLNTSSAIIPKSPDKSKGILSKLMIPTDTSLSGIGSILYFKNLMGKIAIALSLLISLVLFLAFKLIKARATKLYLLCTDIICITVFIIDSFFSSVTLLWGTWALLGLVLFQIVQENNDKNKAYR